MAQTDFVATQQVPTDAPHLLVITGPETGRQIWLDFEKLKTSPLVLGRTNEADVLLRDEKGYVSRKHFALAIRPDDELVIVGDLGSRNGTCVNGQRIAGVTPLFPGDILGCGENGVRLVFIVPIPEMGSPLPHNREEQILPEDPLPGVARLEILSTDLPAFPDEVRVTVGGFCRLTPLHAFSIGRFSDNDLQLKDENVSRNHAQIIFFNNNYLVKDLGAANPTFIHKKRDKTSLELKMAYRLEDGDELSVDQTRLRYRAPRTAFIPPTPDLDNGLHMVGDKVGLLRFVSTKRTVAIGPDNLLIPSDRQILVGRSDNNDLRLSDSSVSRRHARIVFENGRFQVADLGSSNGTLLNQDHLKWPTAIKTGDKLKVGDFEFVFEEMTVAELEQTQPPYPFLRIGEPILIELKAAENDSTIADKADDKSNKQPIAHPLRSIQPFDELDTDTFTLIAPYFKETVYKAGQEIAREGSGRGAFFAILEGKVTLSRVIVGKTEPLVLAELQKGSIYGERTVFADQPFVNRMTASTFVRALRLDEASFVRDLNDNSTVRSFFEQQVSSFSAATWLSGTLLMETLEEKTKREIAGRMRYRRYKQGDVLAQQGAACDEFFLVVGGVAEAVSTDKEGKQQVITSLEEGDTFGDGIGARGATYPMSLKAKRQVDCYVLSRSDFESVLTKSGEPLADLDIFNGLPLGAVLNNFGPFSSMPPQLISQISLKLKTKEFKKGRTIMFQGDKADAFYIIRSGQVELSFETSVGERKTDMTLNPGQFFGEAALTDDPRHSHTVTAIEDCVILTLYSRDFNAIKNLNKLDSFKSIIEGSFVKRYRPKQVADFRVQEQTDSDGNKVYRLSKLDGSSFFELSPEGYFLWNLMDGDNSINDLMLAYFLEYHVFDLASVLNRVRLLQAAGFLQINELDSKFDPAAQPPKPKTGLAKLGSILLKPFVWQVEIRNIDQAIYQLYKYFGWVFFPQPVMFLLVLLSSLGFLSFLAAGFISPNTGFAQIIQPPVANFFVDGPGGIGFWWLWILLFIIVSLFIHELGHALAVKHFGHRVLGGGINFFFPVLAPYVNTNDMYSEPHRGPRILVDLAGPLCNLLIGAFCSLTAIIALLTANSGGAITLRDVGELIANFPLLLGQVDHYLIPPHTGVKEAFFQLASISYTIALFNLIPVIQSDGYYALSNYLNIPNLRKKALVYIRYRFTKKAQIRKVSNRERKIYNWYASLIPLYVLLIALQLLFWFNQLIFGVIKSWLAGFGLPDMQAESIAGLVSTGIALIVTLSLSFPVIMEFIQTSRSTDHHEDN